MADNWLTTTHPHYTKRSERIAYAWDHYSGDVLDKVSTYLHKHKQGETDDSFSERTATADYTPHFAFNVDALAGHLFTVEDQEERTWGLQEGGDGPIGGLGDPSDPDSIMYRIWSSADGAGTNWPAVWRQLAPRLVLANEWWVLIDGIEERRDELSAYTTEASVHLISPLDVLDWQEEGGRLVWVKVRHRVIERSGWESKAEETDRYTLYRLDGWTRYALNEKGEPVEEASGAYEFYETPLRRKRILPIRRIVVPIDRDLGWIMARKANAIFNQESQRDWLLRVSSFVKMAIDPDAPDTNEQIDKRLREGVTWFRAGSLSYASPSAEPTQNQTEILRQKIEHFSRVFFKAYEDRAREVTATEIQQDVEGGTGVYLVLLKSAIDEAENFTLFLFEQVYFPSQPAMWGHATVERSNKFAPMDPEAVSGRMKERYIDGRIPVGRTALVAVVKKILEMDGISYDSDEVADAVDEWLGEPPPVPGVDTVETAQVVTARETQRLQAMRQRLESRIGPLDQAS